MNISLVDFLDRIHGSQHDDDFFREDVDFNDIEDYLGMITEYAPDRRIIFSAEARVRRTKIYAGFEDKVINTNGIIIFYYILHNDDFYCERLSNETELYDRLYKSIRNSSIGEFMVFENGVKRNYRVKNAFEEILHSDEWDRRKLHELIIEWY